MDNNEKAIMLYRLVNSQYQYALKQEIQARAELAGAEVGSEMWKSHVDYSSRGVNPYNVTRKRELVEQYAASTVVWKELVEYTVETFLNGIKPAENKNEQASVQKTS